MAPRMLRRWRQPHRTRPRRLLNDRITPHAQHATAIGHTADVCTSGPWSDGGHDESEERRQEEGGRAGGTERGRAGAPKAPPAGTPNAGLAAPKPPAAGAPKAGAAAAAPVEAAAAPKIQARVAAGGAAPPKLKPPPVEAALEAAGAALNPPNAGLCAAVEEAPVPPKLKPPPVDAADDAAAPNENAMGNELLQARERCCRAARRKRRVLLRALQPHMYSSSCSSCLAIGRAQPAASLSGCWCRPSALMQPTKPEAWTGSPPRGEQKACP
jgi:hypothetical protein